MLAGKAPRFASFTLLVVVVNALVISLGTLRRSGPAEPSLDGPDNEEAIRFMGAAIRASRGNPLPYLQRARAMMKRGLFGAAVRDCAEAIRLDPTSAGAYFNRGLAYERQGDHVRALEDYKKACHADPSSLWAFNNRAWLLATSPLDGVRDSGSAVKAARRACELSGWKDPSVLVSLAAALAESGDFENAVAWQKQAVSLFPDGDYEPLRLAKRALNLYRHHSPLRCIRVEGALRWN
ncbi:MAG: tetratricopeptide repeat protein [Isosphaeraceae bacterium]